METIYFTGFSGSGKTMIGRLLASRKNLIFFDTDDFIEKKENKTVLEIFNKNGEEYFRKLEKEVLEKEIKRAMIVSLGGGIIMDEDNRHKIKTTGRVVYLKAKPKTIVKNLKDEYVTRPLLANNFSILTVEKMMEERRPYYEELANYTIEIDDRKINDILSELLAYYNYTNKIKCHVYMS